MMHGHTLTVTLWRKIESAVVNIGDLKKTLKKNTCLERNENQLTQTQLINNLISKAN